MEILPLRTLQRGFPARHKLATAGPRASYFSKVYIPCQEQGCLNQGPFIPQIRVEHLLHTQLTSSNWERLPTLCKWTGRASRPCNTQPCTPWNKSWWASEGLLWGHQEQCLGTTQSLVSWEIFMALQLQRVLGEGLHQPFNVGEEGAGSEWDAHPCWGWRREIGKFQWYIARKQPWRGQWNTNLSAADSLLLGREGCMGCSLQRASALGKSPGEGDRRKEFAALAELMLIIVPRGSWLLWAAVSSSQDARVEVSDLIFTAVQKHALYGANSLHFEAYFMTKHVGCLGKSIKQAGKDSFPGFGV